MAIGDVEKMIIVGLIWGTTNAFMKKGALIYDSSSHNNPKFTKQPFIITAVKNIKNLILTWQYSVPLLINLSASATFFGIVGTTPISVAVPVTNAVTFGATALMGLILGEKIRVLSAFLGTFFIVVGVWLCVLE